MARVYSARLLELSSGSGGGDVEVPATELWVVRDIDAALVAGAGTFELTVGLTVGAVSYPIASWETTSGLPNAQWRGRQVVNAGESLGWASSGTGSASFLISGYRLTLP